MAKIASKRLCFISRSHLNNSPYAEIALPPLAKDGWDITVFAPCAKDSILRKVLPFSCRAHDLLKQDRNHKLAQEIELLKVLLSVRLGSYDVIYINSQSLSARAVIALAGPNFGKKIVYHNPDYYDPFNHPLYFRLEKALCRRVDLYINNEFHRAYITQTMYRMRCPVLVAPPNLPAQWPIPKPSLAKHQEMARGRTEAFVLMLHGGYGPLRMVQQLFEGLSLLPARFRLVMTGAVQKEDYVDAELRRLGLTTRVLRLPSQTFQELLAYTVNADVGVLLYKNSDLGNFFTAPGRLGEYLACGLPVLASNHTALENLVLRYDLGKCVDAKRPEDIAGALEYLEKAVRQGCFARDRMREIFLQHFAFDHWEPLIVRAFEDLLSTRNPQSKIPAPPPFPWMPKT